MRTFDVVSSAANSPISRSQEVFDAKMMTPTNSASMNASPFSSICSSTTVTDDDDAMLSIELNEEVLTIAEPTHMSWHEVMQSAQILGIPLHRMPTAAASATIPSSMSSSWSQPTVPVRSELIGGRRSSLSSMSMTSSERSYAASPLTSPSDPKEQSHTISVGGCPSSSTTPCHRRTGLMIATQPFNVEESPSPKRGGGKNKKLKSTTGVGTGVAGVSNGGTSGTSPFRAKLQNFFSRKASDENRFPVKSTSTTYRKEVEMKQSTGISSHLETDGERKSVILRRPRDGRHNPRHHQQQQQHIKQAHQRFSPCRDSHSGRAQSAFFDHHVSQNSHQLYRTQSPASSQRVQSWTPVHAAPGGGGGTMSRVVGNGSSASGTGNNGVVGMYRGSMLSVLSSSFSSGSIGSVFSHASSSHSGSNTSSSAAAVKAGPGSGIFPVGRQMSSSSSVGWKNNGHVVGK